MYFRKGRVEKRWRTSPVDAETSARLAAELSCSRVLAELLARRGIDTAEAAHVFLNPSLSDLEEPDLLPGIDAAVERIARAVRDRERITVFGDYDVDGVSSTALLLEFFRFVGYPVDSYIPQRLSEGYGLSSAAIRGLAEKGTQLIVTVDNGSTAVEEVALARQLGMDVVITDHHLPSDPLPPANVIVNPWLPGSRYPFPELAGVGVAFKVVWAVCRHFSKSRKVSPEFKEFMMEALALVALGTIADVVPLRGENRILAHFGLRSLVTTRLPGPRALAELALEKRRDRRLTASDVAFRIGPCINSAGRLGEADLALRALVTRDQGEAGELVKTLSRENERRRRIEREIHAEARERVLETVDLAGERALVLAGEGWHPGVIGIVAARLVDEFFRPTLLIAIDGGVGKGSARSIPQVQIHDAIGRASGCLEGFGGHAQAAGLRIAPERVDEFRVRLNEAIDVAPDAMVPEVEIDGEYALREWTPQVIRDIQRLEPFGQGNREPLFGSRDIGVAGFPRLLGRDGSHLSFFARQDDLAVRAVAFGMGEHHPRIANGDVQLSIVYQPTLNRWRNEEQVELLVRELSFGPPSS